MGASRKNHALGHIDRGRTEDNRLLRRAQDSLHALRLAVVHAMHKPRRRRHSSRRQSRHAARGRLRPRERRGRVALREPARTYETNGRTVPAAQQLGSSRREIRFRAVRIPPMGRMAPRHGAPRRRQPADDEHTRRIPSVRILAHIPQPAHTGGHLRQRGIPRRHPQRHPAFHPHAQRRRRLHHLLLRQAPAQYPRTSARRIARLLQPPADHLLVR